MSGQTRRATLHPHIAAVMDQTGEGDPVAAVRIKARAVVRRFIEVFPGGPPMNLEALASFVGLHSSTDAPRYSHDSEIAPEPDGRVVLRVNRERPRSRQRFSIAHEIGHTLFPEYQLSVRCRKAADRSWADPNDMLESLCDVAASEFMFPLPWFRDRVASLMLSASSLADLATEYEGSREATVRRLVELHSNPLAAVFFSWKLKPKEKHAVNRNKNQRSMFDDFPPEVPTPLLRVDYAILNDEFEQQCGKHVPKDKSVPCEGPIHTASISQSLQDGTIKLNLGPVAGRFMVNALPLFTTDESLGPDGGCSVVALIRPA